MLSLTADMTPKELLQLAHTQARANANVKMQLFYSEKRVEDLTAALGVDGGKAKDYATLTKTAAEQSARVAQLRGDVRERNDIIRSCFERVEALERELEETRAGNETSASSRAAEAAERATSMAAATAETVLRELEVAQSDNASLMKRAAVAEAELAALRETAAALEADFATQRSRASANLRRSMQAVASTEAAEQEIESLRHRLNAALQAADVAAADREVAAAREAAVREELRARESLAAGSLERKVNELRRELHAKNKEIEAVDAELKVCEAARVAVRAPHPPALRVTRPLAAPCSLGAAVEIAKCASYGAHFGAKVEGREAAGSGAGTAEEARPG